MEHLQTPPSLRQQLDALVLAEVEALEVPSPDPAERPSPSEPTADLHAGEDGASFIDDIDAEPSNLEMFNGEEQQVIERTSAWLRGRPNRDMIIDALWSAVANSAEEGASDAAEGELETAGAEG